MSDVGVACDADLEAWRLCRCAVSTPVNGKASSRRWPWRAVPVEHLTSGRRLDLAPNLALRIFLGGDERVHPAAHERLHERRGGDVGADVCAVRVRQTLVA